MADFSETRASILSELARRAPYYVPEWRYNPSSPDAGTALAFLWADMFAGTVERYGNLSDNYRRALLNTVGSDARPSLPSRSYLVFTPHPDTNDISVVPAGTGVASPENPDAVLETDCDLHISSAGIEAVYYASPPLDTVNSVESCERFTLFKTGRADPHVWTIRHDYAFDVSTGSTLRLAFQIRRGTLSMLCGDTSWEFYDDGDWKPLSVREDGGELLVLFPDEREAPCLALRFTLRGGKPSPAELCSVRACPSGYSLFPDAVYAGDSQQPVSEFYPFGQRFLPGMSFFIACRDALGKPGASVEFYFELHFEQFPIEGYPEPGIHWKKLMKASELEPPESYEITVADVSWEYYNGIGWASLPLTDASAGKLFGDWRARTCKLRFICPGDMRPAVCGAHDELFIRARILAVDNLFRMHGHYIAPVISSPRFSYRYEDGVPVTAAEITEHLDTRAVSLNRPVRLIGRLPEPNAVYFAFDAPFSHGTLLFAIAHGSRKAPPLRWEYAADDWQPLDVHDGTGGFSKTGLVVYQTPVPCVQKRLFGRTSYWMRLVDAGNAFGSGTHTGPVLTGLYQNAVPATARTPGEETNLPADSFTSMTLPLACVSVVSNPLPAFGGTTPESEEEIVDRLTAEFSHQNRAIAASDYEQLARAASARICRAACFINTNEKGEYSPESTCLVLLRRDTAHDGFDELKREVSQYIETRRPVGAGSLYITEPGYTAVCVTLQAAIESPEQVLSVKNRVNTALARYLDPVNGGSGGGGWDIGALPAPDALAALLLAIPGVLWLHDIKVTYSRGYNPMDYDRAVREPFVLPVNGEHEIILKS